jgi:tRNA-2-methylthio-N6-dimethylallyladenosine synthase
MPKAVYLETFGCQMNELDSELVAGQLRALGYRFTPDQGAADVVLYNTCSVREHAEQKVWSRLGEMAARKRAEPGLVVGVLGCMAERDGEALIRRMPVVDVLCGPGELDKLPGLLDNAVRTRAALSADCGGKDFGSGILDFGSGSADGARNGDGHRSQQIQNLKSKIQNRRELVSAHQVALQGSASRRSATLAAAADSLEMLDLSRAVSPVDVDGGERKASAYVRITRGCNKFCTYCVVPFTRGAEVHRPPRHIIDECKRLADSGVIEVTLLGQTVNHYRFEHGAAVTLGGVMQPQKGRSYSGGHSRDPFAGANTTTFADLLAQIHDEVLAIQRLRFVTSYPRDFGDDVLEVIRDHPRICRYLHVPGQSGSNRILKAMNRGYTVEEYLEFLARARAYLHQPDIGRPLMISGDIIVGFPGETDEDFAATVSLLEKARYKNCFIFKYSPRPGTIAHDKLPDDVPDEVKRRRNNQLLALQGRISDQISQEQVGQTVDVFVEGLSRKQEKKAAARAGTCSSNGTVMLTLGGAALRADTSAWTVDLPHGGSACAVDLEQVPLPDDSSGPVQLSGRTDGDNIVFFDAPAANAQTLIGRILRVRIDRADRLSLHGIPVV